MIKITKPTQAPNILLTRGNTKCLQHCNDYIRNAEDYETGKRKFPFEAAIYGDESVKQALIKAQHGKCAFCERKFGDDGDVEHFRPKAACCQGRKIPIQKPGYYWLAYDWDNLLLACSICNQRLKRNYFPLHNPDQRVRSHSGNLAQETPLLIHPAEKDPADYIGFRGEEPYAIDGNLMGKSTISVLGLDRKILNELRRARLVELALLRKILDLEAELPDSQAARQVLVAARIRLSEAVSDSVEFASMARAAAKTDFNEI